MWGEQPSSPCSHFLDSCCTWAGPWYFIPFSEKKIFDFKAHLHTKLLPRSGRSRWWEPAGWGWRGSHQSCQNTSTPGNVFIEIFFQRPRTTTPAKMTEIKVTNLAKASIWNPETADHATNDQKVPLEWIQSWLALESSNLWGQVTHLNPQNPFWIPALGSLELFTPIIRRDIKVKKRVTMRQSL